MKYVGPIVMNSLPQLVESLQEWLDSRQEKTVIYISMGSILDFCQLKLHSTAILEGVMEPHTMLCGL